MALFLSRFIIVLLCQSNSPETIATLTGRDFLNLIETAIEDFQSIRISG